MSGKVWNYVYNSENQMTEDHYFEGPSKLKSVSFGYDALGRRVKKAVEDFQTGNTYARKYAYDSNEIIAELDEDNNVLATYTHSGLRTDDVLSAEITSSGVAKGLAQVAGTYMYLKDGLGSVQAITDGSGQLVQRYIYSSFGKLLKIVDAIGMEITAVKTAFTYTNREIDEETGLYYYRARYYDAHSGRFMQEDPDPGILQIVATVNNKKIYVGNNPLKRVDPTGESFLDVLKIGLIITAAVLTGGAAAYALIAFSGATGAAAIAIGVGAGALAGGLAGGITGMAFNLATGTGSPGQGFSEGLQIGLVAGALAGAAVGAGYFGADADKLYGFFKKLPTLIPAKVTLGALGAQMIGMQMMSATKCGKGEQYSLDRGGNGGPGCIPEEEDSYEIPVYSF